MEIDKKIYWIIWKTNCPIVKDKVYKKYTQVLTEFEKNIVPVLKKCLDSYILSQSDNFIRNYKFSVIKPLKLR